MDASSQPRQALYQDRGRACSFGSDPERYDRTRPSYPPELIDALVDGQPASVVDVGCGTGIVARLLQARGCRVLGIEPDPRMAAVAQRRGLDVELATFENWEPQGRAFDLLVSGQAWHWVDPVAGAVQAARVLRPGGRFAVFWNAGRMDAAVRARLDAVYARLAPGLDDYSIALGNLDPARFTLAREGLDAAGSFDSPQLRSFDWQAGYSVEKWLDQLPTHSDHAALPPDKLQALLDGLEDALAGLSEIVLNYQTWLVSAERTG